MAIFYFHKTRPLINIITTGTVLSYLALTTNILIFLFLFRKNLISPATVLMQGLAIADGLTAFFSYGLYPLYLRHFGDYNQFVNGHVTSVALGYPYCAISTHSSILATTFHTVSILLTTCLGIQKVIALRFPIWTKLNLTKKKSLVCCILCFVFSVVIALPRHVVPKFEEWCVDGIDLCEITPYGSAGLLKYPYINYLLFLTLLTFCCCITMLACTVYITFKLVTNKFTGRQTERRRAERWSVIMIVIVVVVFVLCELPKLCLYLFFYAKYLQVGNNYVYELHHSSIFRSFLAKPDQSIAYLFYHYEIIDESVRYSHLLILFEGMKTFTVIACLSNFIIYLLMSQKLRMEFKTMWNNLKSCLSHRTVQEIQI